MIEIQEPASFAFLAGHSTVAEYHEQRRARRKRALTDDAKKEIVAILVLAQGRMTYTRPYHILCMMLTAYYHEWGWVTV